MDPSFIIQRKGELQGNSEKAFRPQKFFSIRGLKGLAFRKKKSSNPKDRKGLWDYKRQSFDGWVFPQFSSGRSDLGEETGFASSQPEHNGSISIHRHENR